MPEERYAEVPIQPRTQLKELERSYLSLAQRLDNLKMNGGYDMTDQRDSAWDKLQTIVSSGAVWIHLEQNYISGKNSILPNFVKEPTTPEEFTNANYYLNGWIKNFNVLQRNSFVVHFMFNVEILVNGLINQLRLVPDSNKFSDTSKKMLKELFPNDWENRRNVLELLAECRNTLHNGGFYNYNTKTIMVDGKTYKFEKGKQVTFLRWRDILSYCKRVIDVLEEICNHSRISSIDHIIRIDQSNS